MFKTLLTAAAFALAAPIAMAGHHNETEMVGPAIGADHSAFTALHADGFDVTLADISGTNGAVVVFSRSVGWCPYCQKQAKELIDAKEPLQELGFTLSLITYDSPETLTGFANKHGVNYNMLSDTDSAMIDAFGLRNHDVKDGSRFDGIPHPAIVYLSPEGEVLAVLREEGYKDRPAVETVLETATALTADQAD